MLWWYWKRWRWCEGWWRASEGGRGWHRDVQDRTPSCLLHNPRHILLPQLLLDTQGGLELLCPVWNRLFLTEQRPRSQFLFRKRKKRNVVTLFLSKVGFHRIVKTRSSTMSCLDVMYPAYGHYAPYAPTAPAFISSLQVGIERICSTSGDISYYLHFNSGSMGVDYLSG